MMIEEKMVRFRQTNPYYKRANHTFGHRFQLLVCLLKIKREEDQKDSKKCQHVPRPMQ